MSSKLDGLLIEINSKASGAKVIIQRIFFGGDGCDE
jgi:hypothetical protein